MILEALKKLKLKERELEELDATLANWSYLSIHLSKESPPVDRLLRLMMRELEKKKRADIVHRLFTRIISHLKQSEWQTICAAYELQEKVK